MSIFTKITEKKEEQAKSAITEYYRLLASINIDKPTPAKTEKLEALLQTLNKSVADAQADHAQVWKVLHWIDEKQEQEQRTKHYEKMQKKHEELCRESQESAQKYKKMITQALLGKDAARAKKTAADMAARELRALKKSNPAMCSALKI